MKTNSQARTIIAAMGLLLAAPLSHPTRAEGWTAEEVGVIEGFMTPESVLVDQKSGVVYVSNVDTTKAGAWDVDGKAFLSRLKAGGELDVLRLVDSTSKAPLNALKGMCLLGGQLYVADIDRVRRITLGDAPSVSTIELFHAKRLNDVATDGKDIYVSDTAAGKVYKLGSNKYSHRAIKAPPMVNGITFHKGAMFAVSWSLKDVYELHPGDPAARPTPFGLPRHFENLDGIEVLDDGTFLVSDFTGDRIAAITPDRRSVSTLVKVGTPADIGLDRERKLLFVPMFDQSKVAVYKLIAK